MRRVSSMAAFAAALLASVPASYTLPEKEDRRRPVPAPAEPDSRQVRRAAERKARKASRRKK